MGGGWGFRRGRGDSEGGPLGEGECAGGGDLGEGEREKVGGGARRESKGT